MNAARIEPFFMVWTGVEGASNIPSFRQPTLAAAATEAKRLAAKYPGQVYYIMEARGAYAIPKAEPQYFFTREGDTTPL